MQIFSVLAAILHMGNIKFAPDAKGESTKIENLEGIPSSSSSCAS